VLSHDLQVEGLEPASIIARFSDHDWAVLRAYRPPYRSALVALHEAGIPLGTLMSLTIGEVATALATGHLGQHPVSDEARPFLAAQLLQRATERGKGDEPFVLGQVRTPGDVINRASRDLGLLIGTRHAPTNRHTLNFWQFRTGFVLQRL
jgi:hypothetical protein